MARFGQILLVLALIFLVCIVYRFRISSYVEGETVGYLIPRKLGSPSEKPVQEGSSLPSLKSLFDSAELGKCRNGPETNFVFTKTVKTGSSTLTTIFARFVVFNNLNLLRPRHGRMIWWTEDRAAVVGPESDKKADALIHHAVFNKQMIDKDMKAGYKSIVSVREPVSWFISAVSFYADRIPGASGIPSPSEVLANDKMFYTVYNEYFPSLFHNVQLVWSGYKYNRKNDMEAIKAHVENVAERADIIMLTDQFDASLIVLKKRFCWEYIDIFYTKSTVGKSEKQYLPAEDVEKLLSPEVNLGEKLLYDRLKEIWWDQSEVKEDGFQEEVEYFSALNVDVTNIWCEKVLEEKETLTIPASRWHEPFPITLKFCKFLKKEKNQIFRKINS